MSGRNQLKIQAKTRMPEPHLYYQMVRLSQDVWRVQDTKGRVYANEVSYAKAVAMMRWLQSLSGPVF